MSVWIISEDKFVPELQRQQETVFSQGNGYLGTRGSFEEGYPGDQPATLINGLFDDAPVVNVELANTPNWIDLQILAGGERFRMDRGRIQSYRRELDLKSAVVTRRVRWTRPSGGTLDLTFERFASLADPHRLALRCCVRSVDFSGEVEIQAGLPAYSENEGLLHWEWLDQGALDEHSAYLHLQTRHTHVHLAEAFSLEVKGAKKSVTQFWNSRMAPVLSTKFDLAPGEEISVEKLVVVYSGRESDHPLQATQAGLKKAVLDGYKKLLHAHSAAWVEDWQACDVTIEGDEKADLALRYSLYGLLCAGPRQDLGTSIPAKSLVGFGYRGHVFWDTDIFVLPFFIYTRPKIARNLLMYRYHTLQGAREKARANGYEGAMYAWESAGDGHESTPRWVGAADTGELIRIWPGDIEHHITADVAYAVMQYWRVSGDDEFMRDYGAEIVLDTARFWGSRAQWNEARRGYDITDVIGPDENHEHVDNNAYTNGMARWNLQAGLQVMDWLERSAPEEARALTTQLDLTPSRLAHWKDIIAKIYNGFDPHSGLFEQFEGYFALKHTPVKDFEPRSRSLQSILGVQGCQAYQVIKQPDVLALFMLLGETDPLYNRENLRANWDYYTPLTDLTYGSSLGPGIHSILASRLNDPQSAYSYFMQAAQVDLLNLRGNTPDGFHAATAGGAWQAAIQGMAGIELKQTGLTAHACLPPSWTRLKFNLHAHGRKHAFDLTPAANPVSGSGPHLPVLGAIFDLDGVLTDTSEMHYQAWQRLADEEGIPFNRKDNEALRGVSRRDSLMLLLKGRQVSEERMQEMMDRKNHYYVELISHIQPTDLLAGAIDLLKELHELGIPVAIGSASLNAPTVIDLLQIRPWITAVVDGESVRHPKPAPDLFLQAASLLNLAPRQCVVFEDAKAGVEAALKGGMWAVGIGPKERVGSAHVVLPGLQGVHWEKLVQALAGTLSANEITTAASAEVETDQEIQPRR